MSPQAPSSTSENRRRSVAARLAGLGAAGVLASFVAAPLAMADDAPASTDTTSSDTGLASDPGSSTPASSDTPTDSATGSASTSAAPSSSDPATSSAAASTGASTGAPSSSAPGSAAPARGTNRTGAVTQQVVPAITPNFGTQKIRVNIALSDPSRFAPGTSLANSVIQAVETGPNAPGTPATCTTDVDGNCAFDGTNGYYVAQPGDTVTFTQQTPPDGPGVLTDVPQVVGPCVIPQITIDTVGADATPAATDYPDCPITSTIPSNLATTAVHPAVVNRNFVDIAVTFVDPPAPPHAVNDSASVHTGHSVTVPVLANDTVYGLPATVDSVTAPAHGHAVISGNQVTYMPTAGWGGTDTFTYTMHTVNGSSTATVTIHVLAPPVANDDSATTTAGDPGASVVIPVLANDNANGGSPLVISFGDPAHGTVEFAGTDELRYTPRGNFVGLDSFQYTITTPNGSATATVRITVTAPHAVAGLADTGAQPEQLGTIAGLLLLAGGWLSWSGRRNRAHRAH